MQGALATLRRAVSSQKGRSALDVVEAEIGDASKGGDKAFGGKPPPDRSAKGVHSSAPFAKRMAKGQGTATARGGS